MKKWIITARGVPNILQLDDNQERELLSTVSQSVTEEQATWDDDFRRNRYGNVWSITEDPEVCRAIASRIRPDAQSVLIPGCGARTALQRHLLEDLKNVRQIRCTDWSSEALKQASESLSHQKVIYERADTSVMAFGDHQFDAVVVVNSTLSGNDLLNRRMLKRCIEALKPGGDFCGFFPTIWAASEISFLEPAFNRWRIDGYIDEEKNTFFEPTQNMSQTFYTPIRLRRILREAGAKRLKFEMYFCDSEYFERENERIYGLPPNSDLSIWEILVTATK